MRYPILNLLPLPDSGGLGIGILSIQKGIIQAMKRLHYSVMASFIMLFFLLSACLPVKTPIDLPTDTPTPLPATSTATTVWFPATQTFTPIATIIITPTRLAQAEYGLLALEDSFNDEEAWVTGSYADGNVAFGEDSLSLAVARPSGSLTSFRKETYFSDFYLELTAASGLCSQNDSFGIAFWAVNARNYYRLALTCSGLYRLERVKENQVSPLTDWLPSAQIIRGPQVSVRVGLWVGGGLIRVYLDDVFQSELYTNKSTGGMGVFTVSSGTSAVTGTFSELKIYDVSPEFYPPTPEPTIRPSKTPLPTIPTP